MRGNESIRPGTAIATFDSDGRYGNHVDGRSHAAIYMGQTAEGILVLDQWNIRDAKGHIYERHTSQERTIEFNPKKPSINDGNAYYVMQ